MKLRAIIISLVIIISVGIYRYTLDSENKGESPYKITKEYEEWFLNRYKDPATGKIPENIHMKELEFVHNNFSKRNINDKNNQIQSLNTWENRGPHDIGGRTREFAFDVSNENRILAGGVSSGIWETTNSGQNWRKTTSSHQLTSVTSIDQDKRQGKQNIWYYGTGERQGSTIYGNGIYKSTNNGNTWFVLPATVNGNIENFDNAFDYIYRVKTNPKAPQNNDEVYVATSNAGILRSTDGGSVWEPIFGSGAASTNISFFSDLEVTSEGVFYATMSSIGFQNTNSLVKGIFRSENGIDWTDITPDNFPKITGRIVIAVDPQNEDKVYFFGNTPESGYQVKAENSDNSQWYSLFKYEYKSGNGINGKWTELSQNLPSPNLELHKLSTQGGYSVTLKVSPLDSNIVYLGGVNLYRSKSAFTESDAEVIGGLDKVINFYPNHHPDVHDIRFLPSNPKIMFTATDGGIHKTLNSTEGITQWESLNNGYSTTQFYSVGIHHNSEKTGVIGGLQDNNVIYSNNNSSESKWDVVTLGDGFATAIADDKNFTISSAGSGDDAGIAFYINGLDVDGKTLKHKRIDPIDGKYSIWNTPFVLDPNDNDIMYLASGLDLWRYDSLSSIPLDKDKTSEITKEERTLVWDKVAVTTELGIGAQISAVAISKSPRNVVYFGTTFGELYRVDNSNTSNPNITEVRSAQFNNYANISSITIDPDDASKVFVCFSNYNVKSIFYSTNSGEDWEQIGGNLEESENGKGNGPGINTLKIVEYDGKRVYMVGTTVGIFVTSNLNGMGTVWDYEAEQSLGAYNVLTLDTRKNDGYTVVGTYGGGIFTTFFKNFPSTLSITVRLESPIDKATSVNENPTLKWEPLSGATLYKLQVSSDANFDNILFDNSNITETETEIKKILSSGFKNYYWRVAGINSAGIGQYSEVWQFQTG
ncbi:MAG: hypothetical protein CVV25_14750, partial [Ignavibacteriae bacterium HGW-Ignavibacteriae-4]